MLVDKLMLGISIVGISQEIVITTIDPLAIRVRIMVTLVEIKGIEVEVEVGLTPV